MMYASFWKRAAAYIIDSVIYGVMVGILGFVCGIVLSDKPEDGVIILISVACYLIYYVWTESSPWQATIGKKLLGLKVTDEDGRRISFMRSLIRNLGQFISGMFLCIGYLMCFWTEQNQCLHDKIAGCLVLDGEDLRMTAQKMDNWTPPELDLSESKSKNSDMAHISVIGPTPNAGAGSNTPSKVGTMDVIE